MGFTTKKVKSAKISNLESLIKEVWLEKDMKKAKELALKGLESSKIKSKDKVIENVKGINSKYKLDYYLANSLLYFEGHTTNIL